MWGSLCLYYLCCVIRADSPDIIPESCIFLSIYFRSLVLIRIVELLLFPQIRLYYLAIRHFCQISSNLDFTSVRTTKCSYSLSPIVSPGHPLLENVFSKPVWLLVREKLPQINSLQTKGKRYYYITLKLFLSARLDKMRNDIVSGSYNVFIQTS